MSYCLNPRCLQPHNPVDASECPHCGSKLIINQRYRVVRPLGEGGCGRTFEVDDNGTLKVLKVLHKNYPEFVSLFKREARVLSRLRHPGIPQVELDGYFLFQCEGYIEPLHCLVMEKIDGLNLKQWLEQRDTQPVAEEQAIAWLSQLVEILGELHQRDYFHRDIKPSNIMLKPNGQLVLIDFGAVKEITDTYLAKMGGGREVTLVRSAGYTPLEQLNGRPLPQSDFFALGRTFVHLLTGQHPVELPEDEKTGQLLWRDRAFHIREPLAALIDWLMEPSPARRPQNVEMIRQYLAALQFTGTGVTVIARNPLQPPSRQEALIETEIVPPKPLVWRGWRTVLLASLAATSFVMGVRYLGGLQNWELQAFDWMMQMRPAEPIDPRLLVVEVTKEDTDKNYPIPDATLVELIQKIEQYKPRFIGLDMHRYEARPPGRQEFINLFRQHANLITVCAFDGGGNNYNSPREFSETQAKKQVGFSDLEIDFWQNKSDRVRRHLLSYDPILYLRPNCPTPYSFSFQLAYSFLKAEGKTLTANFDGNWQLKSLVFKRLFDSNGGYQKLYEQLDLPLRNQIIINYRANPKPAQMLTLKQVLTGQITPELVKDRIVLIGYNAPVAADTKDTPLGQMPGVWVHAHMTSQILSAVIDKRPLLWVLPQWSNWQWGDTVFVGMWSLVGGILAWGLRSRSVADGISRLKLLLAIALTSVTLHQVCFWLLVQGGWMPFIPSVFSLFSTSGAIIYINFRTPNKR